MIFLTKESILRSSSPWNPILSENRWKQRFIQSEGAGTSGGMFCQLFACGGGSSIVSWSVSPHF